MNDSLLVTLYTNMKKAVFALVSRIKLKNAVKRLANAFGYNMQSLVRKSHKTRTTIEESYILVREIGFQPKVVFDVGVASGTPELYKVFADSFFVLIEPLKEFEPDLISILRRYKGLYVLAVAGPHSDQVTFNVHNDHLVGSSLYKETMGAKADGHEITAPMVKIDDIIKDNRLSGPYLIKVDVQGFELAVLDGAQQALSDTEIVVLEVSLFEFMIGAPQFYDVISYMKKREFVAYDIIIGWNRPLDNALGQIDIVFVKEKGMFRRDHSYSNG